ncbi:hypothetical protein [Mesorhizobium sp. M00.F.Ca.ET.216.01.1.1]
MRAQSYRAFEIIVVDDGILTVGRGAVAATP